MRRQKKFYAWGYADEDLTPDEIKPWEAEIAQRYGLTGFDVTPPPKAEEITLRSPARRRADGAAVYRAHRSPDAAGAQLRQGGLRHLPHVHALGAQSARRRGLPRERAGHRARPRLVRPDRRQGDPLRRRLVGGEGHRAAAAFDKVVTISMRHMDKVLEVDRGEPRRAHPGRHLRARDRGPAARHALHHAPLHAGLSLLDAGRLDRHALGRPLRHALHPHRRFRRKHAGGDAGRHAGDAPPAGLRRRPQPRPHVHRLRGHPRHHHRGLGAAAQEADLPRLGLGALQGLLRRRRRGARASPRPASIPPTAGCWKRARRCPTSRGATRRPCWCWPSNRPTTRSMPG